jgi:hypothetical protein
MVQAYVRTIFFVSCLFDAILCGPSGTGGNGIAPPICYSVGSLRDPVPGTLPILVPEAPNKIAKSYDTNNTTAPAGLNNDPLHILAISCMNTPGPSARYITNSGAGGTQ